VARLILDTGVLIAGARGRVDVAMLANFDDVTIPAVAVAEYLAGTLLDRDPGRAAAQRAFLEEILEVLPVHAYDRVVADHHGAAGPRTAHRQHTRRARPHHRCHRTDRSTYGAHHRRARPLRSTTRGHCPYPQRLTHTPIRPCPGWRPATGTRPCHRRSAAQLPVTRPLRPQEQLVQQSDGRGGGRLLPQSDGCGGGRRLRRWPSPAGVAGRQR